MVFHCRQNPKHKFCIQIFPLENSTNEQLAAKITIIRNIHALMKLLFLELFSLGHLSWLY